MQDGRGVDAATIGFEGMAGVSLVLGEELSPYQITVQLEGEALKIPAGAFRQALAQDEAVRVVTLRYNQVQMVQGARSAACNQLRDLEQRMARCLLHTHDWVWEDCFHLTHEFLATMLGVRRPSVTLAARILQQAGLISYRRGDLTILDRQGLEELA